MRNYENEIVQEELTKAVVERQPNADESAVKSLIESMYCLKLSYKEFRRLWGTECTRTEY